MVSGWFYYIYTYMCVCVCVYTHTRMCMCESRHSSTGSFIYFFMIFHPKYQVFPNCGCWAQWVRVSSWVAHGSGAQSGFATSEGPSHLLWASGVAAAHHKEHATVWRALYEVISLFYQVSDYIYNLNISAFSLTDHRNRCRHIHRDIDV